MQRTAIVIWLIIAGMGGVATASQPFVDLHADAQRFADALGKFKEQNKTVPTATLAEQADAEKCYRVETLPEQGKKLDPETLYVQAKPGVVVLGGIFKCSKCNRWHLQCASGFVVARNGLIVTNFHVIESFKKLEAAGVMTADGRVFPVLEVLAASRLNDLALLRVEADNLTPLPVAADAGVGAAVYCISHPVTADGKINCFYSLSKGIINGKFQLRGDKGRPLNVLSTSADYGPGSSGGPILNERGAVVAVACQAMAVPQKEREKGTSLVLRFARPSCSILNMLSRTTSGQKPPAEKPSQDDEKHDAPEATPLTSKTNRVILPTTRLHKPTVAPVQDH